MNEDETKPMLVGGPDAHRTHLDFTGEGGQVEGELQLGVSEHAAAGVCGV